MLRETYHGCSSVVVIIFDFMPQKSQIYIFTYKICFISDK